MSDRIWRPLRIADAPALKKMGVFQGSRKKIEAKIRQLQASCDRESLMIMTAEDEGSRQKGSSRLYRIFSS